MPGVAREILKTLKTISKFFMPIKIKFWKKIFVYFTPKVPGFPKKNSANFIKPLSQHIIIYNIYISEELYYIDIYILMRQYRHINRQGQIDSYILNIKINRQLDIKYKDG